MIGGLSGAFSFVSANQVDPWWLSGGIPAANCIAAYQPKGAASLAASYVNLANPGTYNAAPGTAPTWDAVSGWTFVSPQYLKTGIVPQANYSVIVRFSDVTVSGTRYLLGSYQTAGAFGIEPSDSSLVYYRAGGTGTYSKAPAMTSGILAVAGTSGFRNGVFDKALVSGTMPTVEFYINCRNNNGTANAIGTQNIQAVSFYNIDISSYIVALNTAMAAL